MRYNTFDYYNNDAARAAAEGAHLDAVVETGLANASLEELIFEANRRLADANSDALFIMVQGDEIDLVDDLVAVGLEKLPVKIWRFAQKLQAGINKWGGK